VKDFSDHCEVYFVVKLSPVDEQANLRKRFQGPRRLNREPFPLALRIKIGALSEAIIQCQSETVAPHRSTFVDFVENRLEASQALAFRVPNPSRRVALRRLRTWGALHRMPRSQELSELAPRSAIREQYGIGTLPNNQPGSPKSFTPRRSSQRSQ